MHDVRRMTVAQTALAHRAMKTLKTDAIRPPSEAVVRSYLKDEDNFLAVACEGEKPIGFALAYCLSRLDTRQPMILLYEVFVAAAYRRRGAGRALVHAVLAFARDRGAVKTWVLTDPNNEAARRLYTQCQARDGGANQLYVWPHGALDAGGQKESIE